MVLAISSFTMIRISEHCYEPLSIVLHALCLPYLIPWIYLSSPLYNHKEFDCSHTQTIWWFHFSSNGELKNTGIEMSQKLAVCSVGNFEMNTSVLFLTLLFTCLWSGIWRYSLWNPPMGLVRPSWSLQLRDSTNTPYLLSSPRRSGSLVPQISDLTPRGHTALEYGANCSLQFTLKHKPVAGGPLFL